jgi:hypothetical protein
MDTLQHLRAIGNNPAAVQRSVESGVGGQVWTCARSVQATCLANAGGFIPRSSICEQKQAVIRTGLHRTQAA